MDAHQKNTEAKRNYAGYWFMGGRFWAQRLHDDMVLKLFWFERMDDVPVLCEIELRRYAEWGNLNNVRAGVIAYVYIYILCFFVVNTLGYGVLVLNHVKGGAQYLF